MTIKTIVATRAVFDRLQTLGDETRSRLLLLLEDHEFTVSELCAVLQLPQSTVSRHLKVLAEDGWVRSRADGPSRHYRMAELEPDAAELWGVVRQPVSESPAGRDDRERARSVRARRRDRAREFFSSAAADWDRLRDELFGERVELLPLFGLLDPAWTVADLGAGTGLLSEAVHPFVKRVIAVDSSPQMLEAFRRRHEGTPAIEARAGELESLPIEDGSVDLAFMLLVLHYIVEPADALAESHRVLRPGGRLILVDMREHEREEYRLKMGHVWMGFAGGQIETWARRSGFSRVDIRPLPPGEDARGPLLFVATLVK
jgi:ubiquinone/menaquinone biosynthesis C-methylase UbiE/DNA-binding HxlR family transcriptional regulator